jgi:hypothetical protein
MKKYSPLPPLTRVTLRILEARDLGRQATLHTASVERANRRSTARRWIQSDRRAKQTELFFWDGIQQLNQNVADLALYIVGRTGTSHE